MNLMNMNHETRIEMFLDIDTGSLAKCKPGPAPEFSIRGSSRSTLSCNILSNPTLGRVEEHNNNRIECMYAS